MGYDQHVEVTFSKQVKSEEEAVRFVNWVLPTIGGARLRSMPSSREIRFLDGNTTPPDAAGDVWLEPTISPGVFLASVRISSSGRGLYERNGEEASIFDTSDDPAFYGIHPKAMSADLRCAISVHYEGEEWGDVEDVVFEDGEMTSLDQPVMRSVMPDKPKCVYVVMCVVYNGDDVREVSAVAAFSTPELAMAFIGEDTGGNPSFHIRTFQLDKDLNVNGY